MHYFQFEIKEWVSNTAHLTLEEEAAYFRLIMHYYDSEKPFSNSELSKIFRKCRIQQELGCLILEEFFQCNDEENWIHKRCDQEIQRFRAKSEQASRAGKASAERKANARSTDVQPIINHKSLTINHKSIKDTDKDFLLFHFEKFWDAYGKKVGKPNSIKQWLKINPDEALILKICFMAEKDKKLKPDTKFRKDPERWLKGKHWEDEIIVEQETKPKDLPLGTEQQIEEAYRIECGGDPRLARFNSYFEMKKFILDKREQRARA